MRKVLCTSVIILTCFLQQTVFAKDSKDVTISGFVDASYSYNRDLQSNSFSLDQAEIDFVKEIKDYGSLRADINYLNTGASLTTDDILEQGFLTLNISKNSATALTFGKFNAPIGFELLDPNDMYQFSHALVFDYGLPSNLTGAMLTASFAGVFDLNIYAANGWDNITDNNKDKSFGGRIGVTPMDGLNLGVSGITGPEQDDNSSEKRSVLDVDVTITAIQNLTVGMEFNFGWEDSASNVTPGDDAKWFGLLFMTHYDYSGWGGLTLRYDYFDDKDDARIGNGPYAQQAVTISPTFVISDGFGALIEYRHDFSSDEGFTADNDVFAFEMTYAF